MKPIFVLGPPRSGTTLIYDLFDQHPQIAAESEHFHRFHHTLVPFKDRYEEEDTFRLTSVEVSPELRLDYQKAIEESQQRHGAEQFILKISTLSMQVDYLRALFPQARFIQLVRDGRDAICSIESLRRTLEKEGGAPRSLGPAPDPFGLWVSEHFEPPHLRAAATWFYHVTRSMIDLRFYGADDFLRIRYEDLVSKPRQNLEKILSFSGFEWEDSFDSILSEISDQPAGSGSLGFSVCESKRARRGRYEEELSAEIRILVAELLAYPMRLLGYPADPIPSEEEFDAAAATLKIDAALWRKKVRTELAFFERYFVAFAPERILRNPTIPSEDASPLLIDGAVVGGSRSLRDGKVFGVSFVEKGNRRFSFEDNELLWPQLAPELDGQTSLRELEERHGKNPIFRRLLAQLVDKAFVAWVL
ncbi:sulfotransferase [Myxococcota bacterium]|nr:sulfotransferase [Myxococcota bacterium]